MGLGSEIRDPEKVFSEGQKGTGSRIRIRNTALLWVFFTLLLRMSRILRTYR